MDGQQVFVTGADGEQMVLSGPEAAALLAQAGISLGDQEQVMIGGQGQEDQAAAAAVQDQAAAPEVEGGNILVPEGSSVGEDGSIIAADGTILAPAGTVMIGEDGTLMMAEGSSLLSQDNTDNTAAAPSADTGAVFTTPDGATFKAGEGDILTDADGNVLTDEDGNILTTAHLGALGATSSGVVSGSDSVTTTAPTMTTSDGSMITSDGNFLRTADGNLLTDEEGNFISADGNIMKPEEAHKILATQGSEAKAEDNSAPVTTDIETVDNVVKSEKVETPAPSDINVKPENSELNTSLDDGEPPQLEVRSKVEPVIPPADTENNAIEPEKSKLEETSDAQSTFDQAAATAVESVLPDQTDALNNMPILEDDTEGNMNITADGPAEPAAVSAVGAPVPSEPAAEMSADPVSTALKMETTDILTAATASINSAVSSAAVSVPAVPVTINNSDAAFPAVTGVSTAEVAVSIPSSGFVTTSLPVELSQLSIPSSSDGGIYTTADGRVLSLPEGIVTNSSGHLINPADGSILTTEDGTPLMLPEGAILQPAAVATSSTTSGIMVSSETNSGNMASVPVPSIDQSQSIISSSADGTMIAPEGSMIASDGSILAADGTMLAPPGSVSLTPEPPLPQNPPIPTQLVPQQPVPQQPQNLIGLQLPESGEVLYLDPNDPAAQQLLQEAGIHLGDNGVLTTMDGQVLQGEDGNPITTNTSKPSYSPTKHNNIVSGALAAAGLVDTSDIDIPLSASQGVITDIRPNLPTQPVSYNQLTANNDDAIRQHLSQLQPRYTPPAKQKTNQTQYKKLTFNSGANYSSPAPAPIPKRSIAPKQRRTVPNTDLQIGPDQQKVTYTVTSENGYTQTYMMICSKSLDQNTLINTLIKNISSDPNHKGKKTIKITQHKYGAKKTAKQTPQRSYNGGQQRQVLPASNSIHQNQPRFQQKNATQQRVVQQVQYKPLAAATASPAPVKQQSAMKPPQQLLESDQDMGDLTNNVSLDDIMKQVSDTQGGQSDDKDPRVMVKCNYCPSFRSVLNSQTWENILNHILPVAKEELHSSFYGNILKHFARSLRVSVTGTRDQCEVIVSHGLVCRRTGTWFSVDKPGVELATQLASHIASVQPGVVGPYGARPKGNSMICLFCSSPYTAEDYQRHLKPHADFIVPCLLLAAGAYCATSFEADVRKSTVCGSCREAENQDLRFLPCTKFAADFNCSKRLQATVDCFRDNFDSRGFLQVSNSAMTKCSVCRTPNTTYCALFKPNAATVKIFGGNADEMLSVCANCQKQFVNVVMRENSFEKQLKMFQLHHMEQLCGMLRVLLSCSAAVSSGCSNLLYTVQEGGSLYNASNTLHSVAPAKIVMNPMTKVSRMEEDKSQELGGPSMRYICDQCKFSIDLTRLQKISDRNGHLVDMAIGVVLEHVVPHTESLMAVINTAAFNEVFRLKFEFTATVEGEGKNKKITIGLDRKIVGIETNVEVTIHKDVSKTVELLKMKLKQDKKGNVTLKKKHIFTDNSVLDSNPEAAQVMEVSKFVESANNVLGLYGSSGCNTKLLDYYAECRLCSKFSFPDFRLTAAIKNKDGVALCENCCETILSLCVPSEPERVAGKGDMCLLLGVEKNLGHRLVLSNNTKKWISAEGVQKIHSVTDISNSCQLTDYSNQLVQLLKSHLQAVAERAWSDSSCMTARAGFCVLKPEMKPTAIEVKVTIRPPKAKTPPPKLVITPVNAKQSPANTRLVKITANRRIIPVRDPTSISTPPKIPVRTVESADKSKSASVQSTKTPATSKLSTKLPPTTSVTTSTVKDDPKEEEEEIDSDLEKEDDFESIDAIANFISSSEPPVKKIKSEEKPSNEVTDVLTDEFTSDTALNTPKAGAAQKNGTDKTPETSKPDLKLPEGTIVSDISPADETGDDKPDNDEDQASTAAATVNNGDTSDTNNKDDLKLPPGLVISPAATDNGTDSDNNIELAASLKNEIVPSPASDATTSTKDTTTPSKAAIVTSKGKKPHMPRLTPRQESVKDSEEKSQKDEKTSTVKTVSTPVSNNGKTRQSKRDSENTSDNGNDADSITSLDNDDLSEDEENNEIGIKKVGVKLSNILPKPNKSRNSTPASSSKKGMPGRPKRKHSEEPAASKSSKKAKLSEDEENPATPEQGTDLLTGTSSSGRVRRVKKIFDL